jgi:hypothetical protein
MIILKLSKDQYNNIPRIININITNKLFLKKSFYFISPIYFIDSFRVILIH